MENTMTPEEGSGELTVNEAASQFLSLMDGGEPSEEQVETEESEEIEAQEDEESDEVEEQEEVEEQPVYRIKAAGEEKDVTLEDLVKSYQLGADYTKKTQEIAEQRKAVEAERAAIEESRQLRDAYAQRLQAVEQFLSQQQSEDDLESLKETDPIGYAVKVAELSQKEKQLSAVRAEQQRLAQQQQAEYQQNLQKFVQTEMAKLSQALPEFADPEKGQAIRSDLRKFATSIGYSDEELSQVYDSRHVQVLYKAMQYDKLMQSKPQITKKVNEAPKMLKPGVAKAKSSEADALKKEKARLRTSGRVADAAAIFERFL
jgi:hypothetical protein